jgi:hypothetical protein
MSENVARLLPVHIVLTGLLGSGYHGTQSYREISHTNQRGRDREVWRQVFFMTPHTHCKSKAADTIPLSSHYGEPASVH